MNEIKEYEVVILLNALRYTVEAGSEEEAIDKARELANRESHYDILKWADYEIEEGKK